MNIGIIGLGYVGLTLGIAAAGSGINVWGIEKEQSIKDSLKDGKAHFFEPGIDNRIRRYSGKSFFVVGSFPTDVSFDAFVITVGTPLREDGKIPNFEYIRDALMGAIKDIYDGSQLLILRSTVSVGTTRKIVIPFLSEICGKPEEEILVSMCPERTIEGNAIEELTHLPQIISGNNERSVEIAKSLFGKITPYVIQADSLEEAELIKLYCNTYRDMTFAIGNAFCMAAQEFGVDGINVIKHANQGYHRSNIAIPGFVAGPCLEKDAYILINNMPDCDSRDFILSARRFNESLEDIVINWVRNKIGEPDKEIILTLSGMAFKGKPATSDLRGSSSVYIAKRLKKLGYKLRLHDFAARPNEMEALGLGDIYDDLRDSCRGSSALLVLNNHADYAKVMPEPEFERGNGNIHILDVWRSCTELYFDDNISIYTIGNLMIGDKG